MSSKLFTDLDITGFDVADEFRDLMQRAARDLGEEGAGDTATVTLKFTVERAGADIVVTPQAAYKPPSTRLAATIVYRDEKGALVTHAQKQQDLPLGDNVRPINERGA